MAGFDNGIVYGSNVDFSGTTPVSGEITLDGELLVGSSVAPFIRPYVPTGSDGVSVTTGQGTLDFGLSNVPNSSLQNSSITLNEGTGISITGSPVSLGGAATISFTGSAGTETFHTDSGDATQAGGAITITGGVNSTTSGTGSTVTVDVSGPPSATSLTNHGVVIGQGASAVTATATGSAGQILQSGGASANPAYSTATYPSTAGITGNVLTSDGTNWVSSAPTSSFLISQTYRPGNPADGQTYHLILQTSITTLTTTNVESKIYFCGNSTINACYGEFSVSGTLGSNENVTLALRKNNTSNTTVSSTIKLNATSVTFNGTGLGLSVAAGDYIEVLIICPTWVTNPIGVSLSLSILVQ